MRSFFRLVVMVFGATAASAAEMPRVAEYAIDVTYLRGEPALEAVAEVTFAESSAPTEALVFYLHGELWVDEATIGGRPAEVRQETVCYGADYSQVARRVEIARDGREVPERLRVSYSGKLNPSVVGALSNYMRVDDEGVFLRSFPYSVWFPVFLEDDQESYPVDADVVVRTPVEFMAVVTGDRVQDGEEKGLRVSRWRVDRQDLFNIQLAIRRFELLENAGFHLYSLRDPVSRARAKEILAFASRLEGYFRRHYADRGEGGQLHVAQMPRFGDISSGNMVGISDRVWREFEPASYSGRTVAHELVHPYVQPEVPMSSKLYALVIEGFPSYFHLPAMGEIVGGEFYGEFIERTEAAYLERRRTGVDRRGNPLPVEKPLLEITADEIGTYKDRFVLNDRVLLFFDWLRRSMGAEEFSLFTRELFAVDGLNHEKLVATVERHLPGSRNDVSTWLETSEFPDRFRLENRDGATERGARSEENQ